MLGVVTLRDRLLPLVSLRALLGLPAGGQHGQRGKVVVVSIGEGAVGVVVDATREILRVDPEIIDPAPALLTRGEGDAEITSICRLDGGRRLVALLSPDRLFRSELVHRILAEQGRPANPDCNLKRTPWQTSNSSFFGWAIRITAFPSPRSARSRARPSTSPGCRKRPPSSTG